LGAPSQDAHAAARRSDDAHRLLGVVRSVREQRAGDQLQAPEDSITTMGVAALITSNSDAASDGINTLSLSSPHWMTPKKQHCLTEPLRVLNPGNGRTTGRAV
jgi:hypothetical protein